MPRFGFHVSIAGGLLKAVERALQTGCRTLQIFSRSPRSWACRDIDGGEAGAFREALRRHDIGPLFLHMPYLPNLASPDEVLYEKSIAVLCEELRRARDLGAPCLVTHIGHRGVSAETEALARVAAAINRALAAVSNPVQVVLENTAGQRREVGYMIEHLGAIIDRIDDQSRVGVCLDTAHAFAAGYDVTVPPGLEGLLAAFSHGIGLERLRLIHLNDTKASLGSRVDRHWHIGEGLIGMGGMRNVVNHRALAKIPMIMETPKETSQDDLRNMEVLLGLVGTPGRRR